MISELKAPFIRSKATDHGIMRDMLIALIPVSVMAIVYFGIRISRNQKSNQLLGSCFNVGRTFHNHAFVWKVRLYYALLIGIITGVLRIVFYLPGGVGIAILIMNVLAPVLDGVCTPRVFGHKGRTIPVSFVFRR